MTSTPCWGSSKIRICVKKKVMDAAPSTTMYGTLPRNVSCSHWFLCALHPLSRSHRSTRTWCYTYMMLIPIPALGLILHPVLGDPVLVLGAPLQNLRAVNRSSHWLSKVVIRVVTIIRVVIWLSLRSSGAVSSSHIGRYTRFATLLLRVISRPCLHLLVLSVSWSWITFLCIWLTFAQVHQCRHMCCQWRHVE